MDSKYTSLGVKDVKRKGNAAVANIKAKKFKFSKEFVPCDKSDIPKNNVEEKVDYRKLSANENLQETRRKLPVFAVRGRVMEEIKKNQTMILIGETGSGKTTQIPQLIHEQRLEGTGAIAITQPRRVAAITIALRVAAEMNTELGNIVGYSVRFEDVTSPKTKLKYMTDGILLREAIFDPLLRKYSVIILDEAHERTVSTDVLFGVVKMAQLERIQRKLSLLKIIIMSATMNVDSFRTYYNDCPVIYLEGRTYPVTIYHTKTKHEDYQFTAVCTIFQLHDTVPPNDDFLVFLTGQEEIEAVADTIKQIAKEAPGPPVRVCPLYAGLPPARQLQVWHQTPPGMRKIILATNIAEASVTIPHVKYVIDSGMVKERSWCSATGADRLRVVPTARAAAWQRAGRAGRTQPGAAYRLYTAREFAQRPAHNTPEIVRSPLASTLLLLIAAGIDPNNFPLIDRPPEESIKASLVLLKELGAIENEVNPKLTVLGKKMAAFPIDPKYAKVLLSAPEFNCLEEALSLVAVLSCENVFITPLQKREVAFKAKQKFISPLGDHLTLLNVFRAFSKSTLKKQWCKENYLNHRNLAYATEIRQQLLPICHRLDLPMSSCGNETDQLLKCLLSGLFTNCAWLRGGGYGGGQTGEGRYVTAGGATVATIRPGGALHCTRPPPPAVLYGELVHSKRPYLVTVTAIESQWLPQIAPGFARRCRAVR